MREQGRRAMVAMVLVGAVALGVCGGSSKSSSGATTTAGGATTTAAAASTSNGGATTTAGDTTTTDPGFSGEGSAELCSYIKDLEKEQDQFGDVFGANATPESAKQAFEKIDEIYDQAIAKAPSEIKSDLETTRAGLDVARDLYAKYGYDAKKLLEAVTKDPKLADQLEVTNSPEFKAASDRIDAYVEKVCGVKPE